MTDDQLEDTYPNADRPSGYTDDHGRPVGESLVNVVTVLVSGIETKLLTSNQALLGRITETTNLHDQRFSYVLAQLSAFLDKEDARHDTYSTELQAIVSGLSGLRADVQRSAAETAARLQKHDQDIEALLAVQNDHAARLEQKHQRLDTLETQIRELRTPEMSPEQRQRYITILMRMIAEWEAAHPDDAE